MVILIIVIAYVIKRKSKNNELQRVHVAEPADANSGLPVSENVLNRPQFLPPIL